MLTDAQIGQAFRHFRAEQSLSQQALARKAVCHYNSLCRLEAGHGTSVRTMSDIAQALGHPLSRIIWHAERTAKG